MARKPKVGDVVLVSWSDIAAGTLRWCERDVARKKARPLPVASAGYILKMNAKVLVLVQSVSLKTVDVQQTLAIPRGVIRDIAVVHHRGQ